MHLMNINSLATKCPGVQWYRVLQCDQNTRYLNRTVTCKVSGGKRQHQACSNGYGNFCTKIWRIMDMW